MSFNLESDVFEELIKTLCGHAKYEVFKKDEIIFKIGEQAEKFFIVLKGEIKIYKTKKRKFKMAKKDYVFYLRKIKDSKDPYLLRKIIMSNKNVIDINEYEIPRLVEKINRVRNIKLELEKKKYLLIILDGKYNKSFEKFIEEIDSGQIASNCTVEDIKHKLYDFIGITESDKEEDALIFDEVIYDVNIFVYEEIDILKEGAHFGENGNNLNDRKRTNYVIANTDAELMVFSNDLYQKNIINEFQILKNKEISFLNDNCIFKNVQKGTFLNHYFKYFTIEEYWRGENIFLEMQNTEKVYFIKEGRIDLNIYTSMIKMHNYTKDLINVDDEVKSYFENEETLPKLNLQPKNYMEILKKKKFISLFLFQDNDMLGIEEAFYGFKRLYRATVISDRAFLYSIPLNKFTKLVDFEPKIHDDLKNYSFMKICNLVKRFLNIKNDTMKLVDKNYKEDNTKKAMYIEGPHSDNIPLKDNKRLKKLSNEINIISQDHRNKLRERDSSLIIVESKKQNLAWVNNKNKIYKSVVNQKQLVLEELERYYKNFQDWNKHFNRKMELMLNPPGDQFQFYKNLNFEKNKIKILKSEIEKLKHNSVEIILPNIFQNKPKNRNETCPTIIDTQKEYSKEKSYKKNNFEDILTISSKQKLDNIDSAYYTEFEEKIEYQKHLKSNCSNNTNSKCNQNTSIDENIFQKNNFAIHSNVYPTRLSLLNKSKKISQSNIFMTNIYNKIENQPVQKEKNMDLIRNLNNSIETISYNHGDITSRSFGDKEKHNNISNKLTKSEIKNKNSSEEKTSKQIKSNTKSASLNNSIFEEVEKNIISTESRKKTPNTEFENDSDNSIVLTAVNKLYENFKSTKLFLSQSKKLKSNKLNRINNEYIPRYYSNKFNNEYADEKIELSEKIDLINGKNLIKLTRDLSNNYIKKNPIKKSNSFVPYAVDNSVEAIKKFHKKIRSTAPKKKYNFILKKYYEEI